MLLPPVSVPNEYITSSHGKGGVHAIWFIDLPEQPALRGYSYCDEGWHAIMLPKRLGTDPMVLNGLNATPWQKRAEMKEPVSKSKHIIKPGGVE